MKFTRTVGRVNSLAQTQRWQRDEALYFTYEFTPSAILAWISLVMRVDRLDKFRGSSRTAWLRGAFHFAQNFFPHASVFTGFADGRVVDLDWVEPISLFRDLSLYCEVTVNGYHQISTDRLDTAKNTCSTNYAYKMLWHLFCVLAQ